MTNPYFLMAALYVVVAVFAALGSSLASFGLLPGYSGTVWLRVHLITLGTLTEVLFGIAPGLVAARGNRPKPAVRWDIWLALNSGIAALLVGIPLVNMVVISTGATLVILAAVLLIKQIADLAPRLPQISSGRGRPFYITGLSFLLLGIFIGAGLWFGLGPALRIATPIEVHIHANNWGFLSFMFAGVLIDLYQDLSGTGMQWPRSLRAIFWMMLAGATALVIAPWVGAPYSEVFAVPGILLHLSATVWLLLNVALPARGTALYKQPGFWHLLTSYVWIIVPVLVAPLIILKVPGFPGAGIERNAPQALIYGWALLFGSGLIPYLFRKLFAPGAPATLGGSWFSLLATHMGGVLLWASIFVTDASLLLHGSAYALWVASMITIVVELWRIIIRGTSELAPALEPAPAD